MADSKKDVPNNIDYAVTTGSVGDVPYGLAPQLPITFNRRDGIANIKNYKLLALQNLKMLVLTIPGERIMDPNFGVGIKKYLFEQNTPIAHSEISAKIYNQVGLYLPYLQIDDILFAGGGPSDNPFDSNLLHVRIEFTIVPLQLSTGLELSVETN